MIIIDVIEFDSEKQEVLWNCHWRVVWKVLIFESVNSGVISKLTLESCREGCWECLRNSFWKALGKNSKYANTNWRCLRNWHWKALGKIFRHANKNWECLRNWYWKALGKYFVVVTGGATIIDNSNYEIETGKLSGVSLRIKK